MLVTRTLELAFAAALAGASRALCKDGLDKVLQARHPLGLGVQNLEWS